MESRKIQGKVSSITFESNSKNKFSLSANQKEPSVNQGPPSVRQSLPRLIGSFSSKHH